MLDPEWDEEGPGTSLAELLRRPLELPEAQLLRERNHHSNAAVRSHLGKKAQAKRRLAKLDFTKREVRPCRP